MSERRAGVFCHITSLPGPFDYGDFGPEAFNFIDFLTTCGFTVWQILPLGPTHKDMCPYQSLSAHAGNPLLINIEWLYKKGWLSPDTYQSSYKSAINHKIKCIKNAYRYFIHEAGHEDMLKFLDFVREESYWLEKYALYVALREYFKNKTWPNWPTPFSNCESEALQKFYKSNQTAVDSIKFQQFVFFTQWAELKSYANSKGVLIIGDLPIFVAHESAEVWAHREYFSLNDQGDPDFVAGVPPDYFSTTGQRWGNPHYQWDKLEKHGFSWWVNRIKTQHKLFDAIRIDHFRGLDSYWEIPAKETTAINGRWVNAPGEQLLKVITQAFPNLTLIAEDLGTITPDVLQLRDKFLIPGMLVIQFAFDGNQNNPYLPKNHKINNLVYTATHDNDTTIGWYESLSDETKNYIWQCINHQDEQMPWPIIHTALESVANTAIIPMQDILCLDSSSRMNTPGTIEGNWKWKFSWDQINPNIPESFRILLHHYQRNMDKNVQFTH